MTGTIAETISIWFHQAAASGSSKSGSLHFSGDTLYSFCIPIAFHRGKSLTGLTKVAITSLDPVNTTMARHISQVRNFAQEHGVVIPLCMSQSSSQQSLQSILS